MKKRKQGVIICILASHTIILSAFLHFLPVLLVFFVFDLSYFHIHNIAFMYYLFILTSMTLSGSTAHNTLLYYRSQVVLVHKRAIQYCNQTIKSRYVLFCIFFFALFSPQLASEVLYVTGDLSMSNPRKTRQIKAVRLCFSKGVCKLKTSSEPHNVYHGFLCAFSWYQGNSYMQKC